MKRVVFILLVIVGLLLTIGGLIGSKFSVIDFCFSPAGILGVVLLIWAFMIRKRDKKS